MGKNKKYLLLIIIIVIIVISLSIGAFFLLKNNGNDDQNNNDNHTNQNNHINPNNQKIHNLGTWWWDDTLNLNTYLTYAIENKITEIYYCNWDFDEDTTNFLENCNKNNIKVYLLDGYYKWLTDENKRENLFTKLNNFLSYQNSHTINFAGVHLDIEPHQSPNFDENRQVLIYNLIELINILDNKYTDIVFHYDLPFWLDDEITFKGITKPAYKHIIDIADNVTIMSYRDSAEKIYSVAKDEIEYAKSINKTLNLSVETSENEDIVTFFEEGKTILNNELNKVRELIPDNFGISIHHIKSWFALS
ncbi:MAG: hypothetical protein IJX17_06310 [Clostridia bacterium]|nr:hypothetical protein [Clostridia bacterium]